MIFQVKYVLRYILLGHVEKAFKKVWCICLFYSILVYLYILCFSFFLLKINLCIFSLIKSVCGNNKQITEGSLEFYTGFSCTQTYSCENYAKLDFDKKHLEKGLKSW